MSTLPPDPDPAATSPYPVSPAALRALALTLPRPPADAPETAWQEVVRDGLDALGGLDPRDAVQAMLAVQIVAANAGALDALRLAFEPGTTSAQAHRQRGSAASLARVATSAMRLLKQQRLLPAVPARDWGGAAEALAVVWREAPARPAEPPRGRQAAEAEPETIVKWMDEIDDAEVEIAIEQERREKAGEPPLPGRARRCCTATSRTITHCAGSPTSGRRGSIRAGRT